MRHIFAIMAASSVELALDHAVVAFQDAALFDTGWEDALAAMAGLTGSQTGQLCGFNDRGVSFNWFSEFDPQAVSELASVGADDPRINSRIRIGLAAPLLSVLDEPHFDTEADRRRHAAYDDYLTRWDVPFICVTNLVKSRDIHVGLSVNRRHRDGVITVEQKALFAVLAHHVRAAILMRQRLGQQAALLATGALDQMGMAALACDPEGRVVAMTPAAEALVAREGHIQVRQGRLWARTRPPDALTTALSWTGARPSHGASGPGAPGQAMILTDANGEDPRLADVVRLEPDRIPFPGSVSALVIVRDGGEAATQRVVEAAGRLFDLTPMERTVAGRMLNGQVPEAIAAALNQSIGTVRTHVRNLYGKTGADSQLAFLARLNALR